MRIVYLTHQYFPDHIGGVEVYTRGLAVRMQQSGHEVHIISACGVPVTSELYETGDDGISVWRIPVNLATADHPMRAEYDNPVTAAQLHDLLGQIRPDIVHVMHLMYLSGSALEVCEGLGIPFIVTLADYWAICPRHTLLRWNGALCYGPRHSLDCVRCVYHTYGFARHPIQTHPEALMWAELSLALMLTGSESMRGIRAIQARNAVLRERILRAERIIALSAFQKGLFVRNQYPADRIEVIAHGLETAQIDPLTHPSPGEPLVIGFIASIVPHKGLHILLDALARRPDLDLDLQIYGALQEESDYGQQIVGRLKREPRARLMGTFAPEAMGEILGRIHVLAMPAIWFENEPLVVKAALYGGTPVLASDLGTLSEMVEHRKTGWLVAPGNIDAWADALAMVSQSVLTGQGQPIKSMDQNAVEMAVIYDEVLARREHDDQNHLSGR